MPFQSGIGFDFDKEHVHLFQIFGVRVLRTVRHTPTQSFGEYCCVFKSFHSGERFQKFAFSLKTIHRFSCERDMKTQGCGEIVNVWFEYCDVELCEMVGIGC